MTGLFEEGRRIAQGLVEANFPANAFHHREHCLACACLIIDQPAVAWERELPGLIRRYNLAMGGANTDEAGYHETLTQFFLAEIRRFLAAHAGLDPDAACRALLDSPIASQDYVHGFYTREHLFSRAARRAYLAPDRVPVLAAARVVI